MKKDNLKSIIVLSSICLVVAILMAAVNYITAPVIRENDEKKTADSLKSVLPDAEDFTEIELPDGAPDTVTSVYRATDSDSYAVTVKTKSSYSKGDMAFTVGIGEDGKIAGITVTNYQETKNFGTDEYPKNYIGKDSGSVEGVDLFSGVTYSSTAFRNGLSDAMGVYESVKGGAK